MKLKSLRETNWKPTQASRSHTSELYHLTPFHLFGEKCQKCSASWKSYSYACLQPIMANKTSKWTQVKFLTKLTTRQEKLSRRDTQLHKGSWSFPSIYVRVRQIGFSRWPIIIRLWSNFWTYRIAPVSTIMTRLCLKWKVCLTELSSWPLTTR